MFRDNLLVPSSGVKKSKNYQSTTRNIPHERRRCVERGPASMINATQHKTRLTTRHRFYSEPPKVVYNFCHKKFLMHPAQKTQIPVHTSKFHPKSFTVETDRRVQPARKAVRTGTTQSVHQSWHRCDCAQVADDSVNKAVAVCDLICALPWRQPPTPHEPTPHISQCLPRPRHRPIAALYSLDIHNILYKIFFNGWVKKKFL